jgi:hypothetical protein
VVAEDAAQSFCAELVDRDEAPWPPRTTSLRWSRAARPTGRPAPGPATSGSSGTGRSLSPLPITRAYPRPMSTSVTSRPSTSRLRSPENSMSRGDRPVPVGPKAPEQSLRLLSVQSPRQPTRFSDPQLRARSRGRARWPSIPDRSPLAVRRAAMPRGTRFGGFGSRMARKENSPETAAIRRFTVVGAYLFERPLRRSTTLSPCWPRSTA